MMRTAFALLVATTFFGCAAAVDRPDEPSEPNVSAAQLKAGCRAVCPKCAPGKICPMGPCVLECPPVPCGSATCTNGDVCCNKSCGICTPPGGVCTMEVCAPTTCVQTMACIVGDVWSTKSCSCVPAK